MPAPVAPVASPAQLDPAAARQIDSLLARVNAADAKFWQREKQVRPRIDAARGAAKASEAWSVALVALTGLDAARSEAMVALSDLDAIYLAARVEGEAANEAKAARDQAALRIERQDSVIGELQAKLAD